MTGWGTNEAHLAFGRTVPHAGKESMQTFAAVLCKKS